MEQGMTKVKFCGLRHRLDLQTVNRLKPDFAGFMFYEKSRRFVPPKKLRELRDLLSPEIRAVGVFVNESPEKAAELAARFSLSAVQLHGQEDPDYIRMIRPLLPAGTLLIKAFTIRTRADLEEARKSEADLILLDHGPGGSGEAFDWQLLTGFERPYFLAGGLTPENVLEAVRLLHPAGLDVSSGIETDGRKDPGKMERFIEVVRGSERR